MCEEKLSTKFIKEEDNLEKVEWGKDKEIEGRGKNQLYHSMAAEHVDDKERGHKGKGRAGDGQVNGNKVWRRKEFAAGSDWIIGMVEGTYWGLRAGTQPVTQERGDQIRKVSKKKKVKENSSIDQKR